MADWKDVWQTADAVCFDVDSTLILEEGLDELASFFGVGEEVAAWTRKGMGEGRSFRETLEARLNIVKPTKKKLEEFIFLHTFTLSPSVEDLIKLLKKRGVDIYLVSGGFHSVIAPIAKHLEIPSNNIFANLIHFDNEGNYAGFDLNEPTSKSGGKKVVAEKLIAENNYKCLVVIGDGMTDLEAYPPAKLFIGYGGNHCREKVKHNSPCYVMHFQELIDSFV